MGSTKIIRCRIEKWEQATIDNIEIPPEISKIHALVIAPRNQRKRYALVSSAVVEDIHGEQHLFVLIAPHDERKIRNSYQAEGGDEEKNIRAERD